MILGFSLKQIVYRPKKKVCFLSSFLSIFRLLRREVELGFCGDCLVGDNIEEIDFDHFKRVFFFCFVL